MKKSLFILVASIFAISFNSKAEDFSAVNSNGDTIYYNIISSVFPYTVEVTFKGTDYYTYTNEYSGSLTIPDSVPYNENYYKVTAIGNIAFSGCSGLTSITIPNSVTKIGNSAFMDCSGLTSITIPNSVTSIGNYAFYDCTALNSINIPSSVTYIGGKAFYNTPWFSSQPDGLIYINNVLYKYKGSMPENTSMNVADGTVCISGNAFEWCRKLQSITIPNSVTSIGIGAFFCCAGLDSITIPNSVTSISNHTFTACDSLSSVKIPNSVTSIDDYAFQGCFSLNSITIPSSVNSIGAYAFSYCTSLDSIICESTTPPAVGASNCFEGVNDTIPVYVPCSSLSLYQQDTVWDYFTNFVCNPLSIDEIQTNNISTKLYPNPTIDKSTLEIQGLTFEADVMVYDMVGRVIKTHKINQGTKELEIDLSGYAKGIYSIKILNQRINQTQKLVVQ